MSKKLSAVVAAFAVAICAIAMSMQVEAQRSGVRVQIFLTQAQIPGNLSERGLLGFARGHRAARLQESSEQSLNERRWMANAVFSFNRPPGDIEFHALFYDVHDGARRFVREMSIFVGDRSQRTILHRITLPRPTFRPNRRMEMVVTLNREEIGSTRFDLIGEEVRHTGQVNFSDEEAGQRD